jgi:hypothetical protein
VESDDGVTTVVFSAEQTLEIEAMERGLDFVELPAGLGDGFLVRLSGQLEVDARFLELAELLAPSREWLAQRRSFAQQRLRLLAVVPKVRCGRRVVELLDSNLTRGNVKGTSRTPATVPRRLQRVLRARSSRRSWLDTLLQLRISVCNHDHSMRPEGSASSLRRKQPPALIVRAAEGADGEN